VARLSVLVFCILLAGCAAESSTESAPAALASAQPSVNTMHFEIGGETFELDAGICNTTDEGVFQFALAEARLDNDGSVTATIELFDTGSSLNTLIALEGTRDDGSPVSWYAVDPHAIYDISPIIIGPSITGTANFDSIGGPEAPGESASGTFSITCG